MASPSQDQRNLEETPTVKEMMHKTKVIHFFGRTTPIILQNDNGPCPLLAICNLLLLRNNLSLSSDVAEVSQEKLLSLVAERLIDSNSNVNNKDAGYVENQQQNIADAIDLLPRLATGIDVNIKFRKIDDFEFTRECAIFDLLDIPLYHGWLVDPQDSDTLNAIGSKSYNTLMGELVALETQNMGNFSKNSSVEDPVDNVALTTHLEVPSPSLSRGSPHPVSDETEADLEEDAKLSGALKLSKTLGPTLGDDLHVVGTAEETLSTNSKVDNSSIRNSCDDDLITFETKVPGEDVCPSLEVDKESHGQTNTTSESEKHENKDGIEKTEVLGKTENISVSLSGSDSSPPVDMHVHNSGGDEKILDETTSNSHDVIDVEKNHIDEKTSYESCSSPPNTLLESSKGTTQTIVDSNLTNDGNEPIYGEKHVLEMSTTTNEIQEPIHEAEAEKDSISTSADNTRPRPGTTARQGELIKTFLKNSASQLTIYGLFSLQENLRDHELCVFFRNNHFNTMYKFKGELYILATDQGYLNQPDLVWEKLNEVNGDTVFVDSNFKKFMAENHETPSWDVQNAMTNTAEYLARIDNTAQGNTGFNSDLQLAIALQQQEFEQQQQPQPQPQPQSPTTSRSGLVVGPQNVHPSRPRNSSSSSRQETKQSKDKCTVM